MYYDNNNQNGYNQNGYNQNSNSSQDSWQYVTPSSTYNNAAAKKPRTKTIVIASLSVFSVLLLGALVFLSAMLVQSKVNGNQNPLIGAGDSVQGTASTSPNLTIEDVPGYKGDSDVQALSTAEIAANVKPSVVGISVYSNQSISPVSAGSGIILNNDGYIITNAHVVNGAAGLSVTLDDERTFNATLIGADIRTDLAVIKIDADNLTPASFGDSNQVVVGEPSIAIGNAGGLYNTVTRGIISGVNREITVSIQDETGMQSQNVTLKLMQTDAAINPGNSGGALLNQFGQVIGINSSKLASVDYEGIGFAIPISEAQPIIENIIKYGYYKDRAVLGVTVAPLNSTNGPANGLPSQGLYILKLEENSNLIAYGIEMGDVIMKGNDVEFYQTKDLTDLLAKHKPGETMKLEIWKRSTGKTVTVDAVLMESAKNY